MTTTSVSSLNSFSTETHLAIIYAAKHTNRHIIFLIRLVSLFQLLLLILMTQHIPHYIHSPLHSPSNLLQKAIDFGITRSLLSTSSSALATLLCLISYFLLISGLIITSYFSVRKNQSQPTYQPFFSTFTTFHADVLFYPIAQCLNELLIYITHDKLTDFPLLKGITIPAILIIYILNVMISFCKIGFCYSKVQSIHFISRKNSAHLLATAALKLFLSIFESLPLVYTDIQTIQTLKIAAVAISFLVCCGLLFYSRTTMPEYSLTLTKMHIIFESFAVFLAVFGLAELIAKESTLEFMVFLLPLWIKLNLNAFNTLVSKIIRQPEKYSKIKYAVNLETILQELEPSLTLNSALEKFSRSAIDANWIAANNSESEPEKLADFSNQTHLQNFQQGCKTYLKEHFEKLLQKNPKSTLGSLVYAQLILRHFGMYSKAYYSCMLLSSKKISIPDKIAIFSIISELKESLEKEMGERVDGSLSQAIWQGFIAENAYGSLRNQVSDFAKHSRDFWKLLETEKPDTQNLITKSKTLEKLRNNIEAQWRKNEELFNKIFPLGYLLYGLFKSQFENLPWEGANYIEKYLLLSKNRFSKANMDNKNLNLANCVTIMISGEKSTLGNIMNCSESVFKLFGIKKDALIGRTANLIMPRFFHDKHDNFLKRYYETGKAVIMGKESRLFAKDSKSNIFPISVNLTIQPNLERGIAYTGLIKKIEDKCEYILFTEDGTIEEASVKIREALCIEPYQKVSINSLFPEYTHKQEKNSLTSLNEKSKTFDIQSPTSSKFHRYSKHRLTIHKQPGSLYKMQDVSTMIYENKALNIMKLKYSNTIHNETFIIEKNRKAKKQEKIVKDEEIESILSGEFSEGVQSKRVTWGAEMSTNRVLLSPKSFRNTENNMTEHKLLTTEAKFDIKSEDSEENSDEKSFENVLEMSPTVLSDERKGSSLAPSSQGRDVDNFQKLFQRRFSSRLKTLATTAFILILACGLTITIVQYAVLEQSVDDIEFTMKITKLSYDRLSALSWIWRYAITYKARIDGIVAVNYTQLDTFKTYLKAYSEMIHDANHELADVVSQRQSDYQQLFFEKNVRLTYNQTTDTLGERIVDSYEAINLFIEKLAKFESTPHTVLFQTGNPDLDFVQRNSMGDLLIVSESLINTFGNGFISGIEDKKLLMLSIFSSNLVIAFVLILFPIIYFCFSYQSSTKLFRAILTIHPRNVKLMIVKFERVSNLIHSSPEELYSFCISNMNKQEKSSGYKLTWNNYKSRRFVMNQLKNIIILIVFIAGYGAASSIGFNSSYNLLSDLLVTHGRVVSNSQAQYNCNLAFSSLLDMILSRNTTTIRNQPADQQLIKNIDAVYSSDALYNVYTDDSTGKFTDPRIEILFKSNPCPYVYNYPGINNTANCPKVTQNSNIGIFAVNSDYKQDLNAQATQILGNLTVAKSKSMFSSVTANVSPKSNTVIGAFLFLNDVLNEQLNNEINELLDDGRTKLIMEIILMNVIGVICIWLLIKKVFDDDWIRMLLRVIPFEEASKNKLLQNVLKDLYKGKDELHHLQH